MRCILTAQHGGLIMGSLCQILMNTTSREDLQPFAQCLLGLKDELNGKFDGQRLKSLKSLSK